MKLGMLLYIHVMKGNAIEIVLLRKYHWKNIVSNDSTKNETWKCHIIISFVLRCSKIFLKIKLYGSGFWLREYQYQEI